MKDGMSLWRERVGSYWNEAIRYLRLIANSGFLFTVYVLLLIGSVYYSRLLDSLPESFPTLGLFTILYGWFLTRGNVRTFVKPADVVFLLPYEQQLDRYFRSSVLYSMAWQSISLFLLLVVLAPLYSLRLAEDAGSFWFILLMLLVAKAWNVMACWEEQRLQGKTAYFILRGFINLVFAYLLFSGAGIGFLVAIVVVMIALYILFHRKLSEQLSLKWEQLIETEQRMVMFFLQDG